jgi:hypothetical protein
MGVLSSKYVPLSIDRDDTIQLNILYQLPQCNSPSTVKLVGLIYQKGFTLFHDNLNHLLHSISSLFPGPLVLYRIITNLSTNIDSIICVFLGDRRAVHDESGSWYSIANHLATQ